MMDDDYGETRYEARQHLIAYAAVGVMVAALVISVIHTKRAYERVDVMRSTVNNWAYQTAMWNQQVEALLSERDYLAMQLVEQLERPDRIVTVPCVEPAPVPVFSRDTQFIGTHP